MDIHIGQGGPRELLEMLAKIARQHEAGECDCDDRKALFIVDQYPDIAAKYRELKDFDKYAKEQLDELGELLKQRTEFLKKKHQTLHKSVWDDIESMMKEKGLYPEGEEDASLAVQEGVMYHQIQKKG